MTIEGAKLIITTGREAYSAAPECKDVIIKVMQPLISAVEGEFSLLGLGDIVIPGIFVAILLTFRRSTGGSAGFTRSLRRLS